MNKLSLSSLIIESTRRCNMTCNHCLRGPAQKMDMDHSTQREFLGKVQYISTITFTGGEPSLYPKAINDFVDICQELTIDVGRFYIATNAKQASDEFMLAVLRLHLFCSDNECSSLDISNDKFHQNDPEVVRKLQTFTFTHLKYNETYKAQTFVNEGYYAENYGDGLEVEQEGIILEDETVTEGNILLTCDGYLVAGCNWSFENQKDHRICHVSAPDYLEEISGYHRRGGHGYRV